MFDCLRVSFLVFSLVLVLHGATAKAQGPCDDLKNLSVRQDFIKEYKDLFKSRVDQFPTDQIASAEIHRATVPGADWAGTYLYLLKTGNTRYTIFYGAYYVEARSTWTPVKDFNNFDSFFRTAGFESVYKRDQVFLDGGTTALKVPTTDGSTFYISISYLKRSDGSTDAFGNNGDRVVLVSKDTLPKEILDMQKRDALLNGTP